MIALAFAGGKMPVSPLDIGNKNQIFHEKP